MNSLNRVIHKSQVVIVDTPTGQRAFICQKGPGMVPSAKSSLIFGKWLNGKEDYIKGDWIVKPSNGGSDE